MTVHITLSGSRAERFLQFKAELGRQLGYQPSNPEAVGFLMASIDSEGLQGDTDG